jgi:3-dehydroquinate synthase
MRQIQVSLGERSYPIYLGLGSLDQIGSRYADHKLGHRVAIITDKNVGALYGERVQARLAAIGIESALITLPDGEETKNLAITEDVYAQLIQLKLERSSTIIALGGGVIGDLAGFIAATYLRGISFVQVPTTLMAQVDSSIGGKTGVNHRLGKNLIGAFHQPEFVLIDSTLLRTLPERELWSGLSEVIKYGLIRDGALFQELEQGLDATHSSLLDNTNWFSQIIERCCEIKAQITSEDEKENGVRRFLNFGHTIGHALEAASQFELKHGEAVAWGMMGAVWLSCKKKYLDKSELEQVISCLKKIPKPSISQYAPRIILEYLYRDKKASDGQIQFVLIKRIGEAFVCQEINEAELRETLQYLQSLPSERL